MDTSRGATARVGFAVDRSGHGIVYARLVADGRMSVLRASFRVQPDSESALRSGFAAIAAIGLHLRKRTDCLELQVDDAALVAALTQHGELPVALLLPYVRARCALNAFAGCRVRVSTGPNDLAARALAEVSMRVAA